MKLFDWLCGCDTPPRCDDSAQYTTTAECGNGVYPEKKPPVYTEQPKPVNGIAKVNGIPHANGVVLQNGHVENGHHVGNGKPVAIQPVGGNKVISSTKERPLEAESFSVPDFKLVETSIHAYRQLVDHVRAIMTERRAQLERLIEHQPQLPNEVDEDARSARGKIIVLSQKNLTTFEKLLKDATDEPQSIADLTGFWGLVHKELLDVQKACERVEASRLLGWKPVPRPVTPPPTPASSVPPSGRSTKTPQQRAAGGAPLTPGRTPKSNPNLRAFMAQKRREMKSSEQLAPTGENGHGNA